METKKHNDNQQHNNHDDGETGCGHEHRHIYVNNRRFDEAHGVKPEMTIAEIAKLVGVPADIAVVRRYMGHHCSEPMDGDIEIVSGDHFTCTRKKVDGGKDTTDRVDVELENIRRGGGRVERLVAPASAILPNGAIVFYNLPIVGKPELGHTDVLVPVPGAYPGQMIDHAALPADSPLIGRVKGSPQEVFSCGGRQWRKISYHPHGNGGAGPWNPQVHGFDTYLGEILSWLGDIQ